VMPFHRAQTALEAKFSLEFICAAALLAGRVGLAELTDAYVQRPEVQALMQRVEIATTEETDPDYSGAAPFDVVRVVMDDGTELVSEPVHRASGHADRPLSLEERWGKFADGATAAHCSAPLARRSFELLNRIDALPSLELLPDLD
jgi:2-methylcitrate dehydratase PrpD